MSELLRIFTANYSKMKKEKWAQVPGYEDYMVSDLGRVKSLKYGKERIIKIKKNNNDYSLVVLYDKKPRTFGVHQLVAMGFCGHQPRGSELVVHHINKNKSDNRLENLKVTTNRKNLEYSYGEFSSKYKGVSWSKGNSKWRARPYDKDLKKEVFLGYFNTEEQARIAVENYFKNKAIS